jgi:hypothetical protein
MARATLRFSLLALSLAVVLLPAACKLTPESQRTVEEKVTVPGLEESLVARDRAIATAVSVALHADPEIAQNKLTVECRNAKVILKGVVPSQELKDRAEKIARAQESVKDVLNELKVDTSLADQRFSLDENEGSTDETKPEEPSKPTEPTIPKPPIDDSGNDDIGGE